MTIYENFRSGALVQGGQEAFASKTVVLTADNQVLDPGPFSYINLESDNTTATSRTFTILNGAQEGQSLELVFTSGSSTTCELISTGNVVLPASWTPVQDESLKLRWSLRRQKWEQVARGASTKLADLASGISPSHVVKFAGSYTTLGGAAAEAQTVTGVAASDVILAQLWQKGATPRTILTAVPTTNTITYTFSGDPSTDHKLFYCVLRAAS